jgi:predicted RNA-binding Zn ribbon-like protein
VVDSCQASTVSGPVALVLGFANTHDHLGHLPDRFGDAAGLQEWLASQDGVAGGGPIAVTPADVLDAREIRDALVAVLSAHADISVVDDDELVGAEWALRRAAQRYPLQADITRAGAGLISGQRGLAGVVGSVLAAVVELSQSGGWNRVKACRDCRHGFVDQSRNSSAGFCSSQCKSRAGMRAYRSRQRHNTEA